MVEPLSPDPRTGGLNARVLAPEGSGDGTPVLVLLHGRGADPSDLASLRSGLPDRVALVLPRAPHEAAQWGYGPGWAWYRYQGEDRPEVDTFRRSQAALGAFLEALPLQLGFDPGPVVLGGFSQGGTTSLGYGLSHPGAVTGVMVFSGFLPAHPDVAADAAAVAATRFWWGHGTLDPAIPHALATRGRSALSAAGADLEARDYPIGHAISPEELTDASRWLTTLLAR